MHDSHVMEIIKLCRELDETAGNVYTKLSSLTDDKDLSNFWIQMSKEEALHTSFWKRAELFEAFQDMPNLFEHPEEVIADLKKALSRSRDLLRGCEENYSVQNAFTLAYRMEFYLLHPAFEMLFHLLGPAAGGSNPEDAYESHIFGFIDMLSKYCHVTPELELLGETLQRLWKENKNLALQSSHDELTEVLNRRGFFTLSIQFAYLAQRTQSTLAVMMLDLDHFKSVNDRHGHIVGDSVLKGTARLIKKELRSSDIVGRYGGEEFIVLLTQTKSGATKSIAEKIRKSIEKNPPDGIPLTVSIGFAEAKLSHQVREDYMQLIQKADTALYSAKDAGRNRTEEYTQGTVSANK